VTEQLSGLHVLALDGLRHVGLGYAKHLRLDQRADRPFDDQPERRISVEIRGNDRTQRKPLRQKTKSLVRAWKLARD
jgi:hypothetical protein